MQTTLRIDKELYRQAKAEAARQGRTITRFIEEALELRLRQGTADRGLVELPTFRSDAGFNFSPAELKELVRESQSSHDLRKLGRD